MTKGRALKYAGGALLAVVAIDLALTAAALAFGWGFFRR